MLSRAPGRIEVLGNHLDYNGGLVLACTIDQFIWTLGASSDDVTLYSTEYQDSVHFRLEDIQKKTQSGWGDYARGVYWAFDRRNHSVRGVAGIIHSSIPQGVGLSSSAALEVSLTNIIANQSGLKLHPKSLAMLAFEAERLFCGISCGVMDQFTSQLGKPDSLLAIQCANLMTKDVSVPNDVLFIVVNSMVSRTAGSVLNERKIECTNALATLREAGWNVGNLSSIKPEQLSEVSEILDDTLTRRVTHIVHENQRVRDGISALIEGHLERFGNLMIESYASSRDLYEVSHPNLDTLMNIGKMIPGVLGCRLTGAGLGGSLLILSRRTGAVEIAQKIVREYEIETGLMAEVSMCSVPGGVVVEEIEVA